MKVFVESRFIMQSRNGISRDSKSIVTLLNSDPQVDLQTFTCARAKIARGLKGAKAIMNGHPSYINFGNAKVFIPQLQGYLPTSKGTAIIRIHDIYPITNPEWFRKISVRVFKLTLAKAVENEHLFVCNSMTTRDSLLSIYPTARTELIYCNSHSIESKKCGHCEYCSNTDQFAKKPFLLSVGTIEPRKNYESLIRLWERRASLDDLQLVIVGKYGWKSRKVHRLLKQKNQNMCYLQDVCDGGVQELTKTCKAYLSLSLGEGFNLPAMDAAKNLKPLVLSDIPIHKELYGKMATYFDPQDLLSISQIVNEIDFNNLEPVDNKLIPKFDFEDQVLNLIRNLSKERNE